MTLNLVNTTVEDAHGGSVKVECHDLETAETLITQLMVHLFAYKDEPIPRWICTSRTLLAKSGKSTK